MLKLGFPCIGLEIGLGHILCVISFLDIDIMAGLRIGIWKWIGVYMRSCICSKMLKLGFPCIGLVIGSGHILCVISFLGIDMMASLSIGICDWGLSEVLPIFKDVETVFFVDCNGKSRSHFFC